MKILNRLFIALALYGTLLSSCRQNQERIVEGNTSAIENALDFDPLPSWNEGETKSKIINYVSEAINAEGPMFIPVSERIATFDNDGTLWSEQPHYFEYLFALDRVKVMAAEHPEWKNKQPYKAILENDTATLNKLGIQAIYDAITITHSGMTTDEFETIVKKWAATAKHPTTGKLYTEMVFQPMLELLDYLRANEFKTFIVSGGGIDFMRAWTANVYKMPSYQVVGSTGKTEYDYNNGSPVIHKLNTFEAEVDNAAKPEAIQKYIGLKPVFAAGNSDGDLEMLRWTDSNRLNSLQLYIHHTDSIREWAYDRDSDIARLNKGLNYALEKGWTIANIEIDWKVIYPFQKVK